MRLRLACAAFLVGTLGFAPAGQAAPITYEVLATASGTIGGMTFSNAAVRLTGTGDTDNVVDVFGGLAFANPLSTLTVTIAGVGTALVTEATQITGIPSPIIDPELPPFPLIIIGRTDFPPDLVSFTGIGAVGTDALLGYDLKTAIGPVSGGGGIGFIDDCGTAGHDPCIQTSLGALSFTTNISPTGQGTFAATVQPADLPEPATVLLLGAGVPALVRRVRRAKLA